MLYHLIDYLEQLYQPPGFQIIQFITVRAAFAGITAMFTSLVIGRKMIHWLERQQIGEQVREGTAAGFIDHAHKRGTPTMGGVIMLLSILGSTLLWGAGAVVGTVLIARRLVPDRPGLALAAGALTAFNPHFLTISSVINNDAAAACLCTLALWACIRLVQDARKGAAQPLSAAL